ncbi:MAG: hypothetical protein PHX84_01990 [Candidatus Shapirobacteria bacterium]|nr:hypothetical protein [Candidatus Shapirobacteria bacterium]
MSERPSPIDFIKNANIEQRNKENQIRTENITRVLVENSGIFGGSIEEERSQQKSQEILDVFGAGYKSAEEILNTLKNPSATDRQKEIAKENLGVLGKGIFVAMNKAFGNYSNEATETITSQLTGEQIDDILPPMLRGVGEYVKKTDKEATDEEKKKAKEPFINTEEYQTNGKEEKGRNPRSTRRAKSDYIPPIKNNEGEWEGGARWEISPEYAADAMKNMDSGMRWQSYTPPEWMKKLDMETQKRIEYMVMINDGAAGLSYAGKDLDKIQGNRMYFAFSNEKFTTLFNPDFKLVMSKMLNDLCEFDRDKNGNEVDKNGQKSIRYKEGINQKGKPGIDAEVEKNLEKIMNYKESLADFLAKENGRKKANYMDKMNAYTAWNLFYMFGDSSVADRRRVLPTYGGIISDALRTLNPEYKALGKWKVSKADQPQSDLEAAEWFGGPLGAYVQTVMQLERDLGRDGKDKPITGDKTLREKMISGKISLLNTKTFYGFFDFTTGGRDLYDKNGDRFYDIDKGKKRKETLSSLLMNYGFTKDGQLKAKDQREDFNFGDNQVDFLNWYRDQMEASALVLNATTGKEDVRDVDKFVSKIRTAFGMIDGIKINGEHPFKYTKDPDLWANMLLGSFGVDLQRLSTDYIYMQTTQPQSYAINISRFIIYGLGLSEKDVDTNELMRRLGIDIKDGESIDSFRFTMRNEIKWKNAKRETDELIRRSHSK